MRTLVVGDVHNRWNDAEDVVKKFINIVDEIVFVGDYFDDFGDTTEDVFSMVHWLKENVDNPKLKFIIGNHDMHYKWVNPFVQGSGWTAQKHAVLNNLMPFNKLKPVYESQGFIFSHAGITEPLLHPLKPFDFEDFEQRCYIEMNAIATGEDSYIFGVGKSRGGMHKKGGITWADWNADFVPIPGMNQIVGHTHSKLIQYKAIENSINVNVDCFPYSVLLVDEGKFKEMKRINW